RVHAPSRSRPLRLWVGPEVRRLPAHRPGAPDGRMERSEVYGQIAAGTRPRSGKGGSESVSPADARTASEYPPARAPAPRPRAPPASRRQPAAGGDPLRHGLATSLTIADGDSTFGPFRRGRVRYNRMVKP